MIISRTMKVLGRPACVFGVLRGGGVQKAKNNMIIDVSSKTICPEYDLFRFSGTFFFLR